MYASPEERATGISEGRRQPGTRLTEWLRLSSDALEKAMDELDEAQWASLVLTAQGRTFAATEIPCGCARARYGCTPSTSAADSASPPCPPTSSPRRDDIAAKRRGAPGPEVILRPTRHTRSLVSRPAHPTKTLQRSRSWDHRGSSRGCRQLRRVALAFHTRGRTRRARPTG
ncbi:hypothetical protein ACRAWF_27120 [Streptomyces sp. L7]